MSKLDELISVLENMTDEEIVEATSNTGRLGNEFMIFEIVCIENKCRKVDYNG